MRSLRDIPLNKGDLDAISRAAQLLRERFPVAEVVLFGSKARGDDTDESDIDLLVLTTRPCSWADKRAMMTSLGPLQREHGVVFSPVIVPRADWEAGVYQVLPIHAEVERDGVAA